VPDRLTNSGAGLERRVGHRELHRHRCHILDLLTPTPGRLLVGSAVTISYFPSCLAALDPERYNLANLFYEAVGDEPARKVIVLASNGYTDTSMGGGTKLPRLHQNGCAGVLTDGPARVPSTTESLSIRLCFDPRKEQRPGC
jgi:4-hydroxy-4-methyl-2-oxoglutarate aldolase